jgi:hypothetical protein
MIENQERAERVLRARLAKERRYYGIIGKVQEVEHLGFDEEGFHNFVVTLEKWKIPQFYSVKLYAKSARVYQ